MAENKKDEIQHEYRINAKDGLNTLSKLQLEYNELTKSVKKLTESQERNTAKLAGMKEGTKSYEKLSKSIKETDERLILQKSLLNQNQKAFENQTKEMNISSVSTQQLKRYLSLLQDEYQKLNPTQANFTEAQKKLRIEAEKANKELQARGPLLEKQTSFLQSLKGGLPSALIGGIAGGAVGVIGDLLGGIFDKIGQKIQKLADKSDALADLQLAFQTTAEDAKSISTELNNIDSRTGVKALREIATAGGLLDVPREELQDFIKEADQAVVVLKKDFPGGIEETTTKLGKLKELYTETKDLKFGDAIRKDASAIKVLSDNGTATAGWLTNFATTMGRVQPSLRPSLTQILGIGAAFEEAGFNAETAATNVTKVLTVSAKNTGKLAEFFGKTKKEIKELINTKPNEFLLEFAQRLAKLNATDYSQTLEKLKLGDAEVGQVLGVLGNQIDNVRKKQEQANDAFVSGTRITESFDVKNKTFAANLEKLSKNWSLFMNDSTIANAISNATSKLVEGLNKLIEPQKELNQQFNEQTASVKRLDSDVKPLLDKYDKLSKNKSAENQAELKKIIGQIITIMPNASYQVDQYGNAISVNTTKTREFIEQQRAMLQIMNKGMIDETAKKNIDAQKELKALSSEINRVQKLPMDNKGNHVELNWGWTGSEMVTHDLNQMNAKAAQLRSTIKSTYLAWKGFKGEIVGNTSTDTTSNSGDNNGTNTDFGSADDKAADKQKQLLEQRKENTQKVVEEIYRMNIEAIDDESAKKKAKLEADLYFQYQERLKLVDEQKMEQKDLDAWYVAQEKSLQNSIAQIDKEASDKKLKEEKEAAEKVAMMVLQTRLDNAEASGDEEQILLAKIAIEKQKFDIEIEKATNDMKQALYEQYLANIAKLHADHRKKEEEKEKSYGQKIFEILKKNAEKKKQAEDKEENDKREAYKKLAEAGEDFIFSVLSARLEKQGNAVDKQYDREQKALERNREKGLLTEEDYTAQKTALEKQYQQKVAEIKRKQAIYDKAQALINIAINTAVAISKAAPNPLLMGLAAGAGVLQAGVVLAKPLPELPSFYDGGDTNVFDRRMPAHDGKNGFVSVLHKNEYVIPEKIRNTRYWANIEPVIEAMRTNKMQSFDKGGSRTPMPSFSNSTSTAQPQAITVDLGPDFYNLMIALKSQMDVGITLNYHDRATLAEKLAEQEQMYKNSMISKTPNSL